MTVSQEISDLVVIGGGASGLACAVAGARLGLSVTVFEKMDRCGHKLCLTGGRKANFTHEATPATMAEKFENGRRLLPLLRRFPYERIVRFFDSLGIASRTDADGCVWPKGTDAAGVRDRLVQEATRLGAEVRTSCRVVELEDTSGRSQKADCRLQNAEVLGPDSDSHPHPLPPPSRGREQKGGGLGSCTDAGWTVVTSDSSVSCRNVCVATGGASFPQTGSTGDGLGLCRRLGLETAPWFPALCALRTAEDLGVLAGITQPRVATELVVDGAVEQRAEGPFVFAHQYVSGAAVLVPSGCAARALNAGRDTRLRIDWVPDTSSEELSIGFVEARRTHPRQQLLTRLAHHVARRLGQVVCTQARVPRDRTLSTLTRAEERQAIAALKGTELGITGTEPMERATVTGGGVSLDEVDIATCQTRRFPGLFITGELLDTWAETGGYNLHFAWATGIAVAEAIAEKTLG